MVEVMDGRTKEARALKAAMAPDAGEDITYLPGDGDPHTQKWLGYEFKANVPVRVTRGDLIQAARNNRYFRVGSDEADVIVQATPKTSMEYRAYVVGWMKSASSIEDVATRWAADRSLRGDCEVAEDDLLWLGTLVEPKLTAFKKAEGLSDAQVAGIWISHGVLELPWRT